VIFAVALMGANHFGWGVGLLAFSKRKTRESTRKSNKNLVIRPTICCANHPGISPTTD
jgi:hypothetical protein